MKPCVCICDVEIRWERVSFSRASSMPALDVVESHGVACSRQERTAWLSQRA
jgi:hypothetical protein